MDGLTQLISAQPSFAPLFNILDDIDRHRGHRHQRNQHGVLGPFRPKFDIRDLPDAYELEGEVPGVQKQDLVVEFDESQALVIRGRVERFSSSRPAPPEEAASSTDNGTSSSEDASVTKSSAAAKKDERQEDKTWVTERSVGEFMRSFVFPDTVDQHGISAKLSDGILSIRVPKARKDVSHSKRITIA